MRVEIAKWAVKWYGTTPWDDLHEEQREIWMGEADELLALMEGDQQRPHIEDAVIDHIDRIEAENKRLLALVGEDREPVAWVSPRKLRLLGGSRGANRKWVQVSPFPHDEHDQALYLHPPTGGEVVAAMDRIEEEVPTIGEHGEDARYNWPERWQKLRAIYATEGGEDE